jgi:hypothetical protein
VYGPLWQRHSAGEFVDEFVAPHAVVTAWNTAKTRHGEKLIIGILEQVMAVIRDMRPTVIRTRPIGANAAVQFVAFRLEARDPARQNDIGGNGNALYRWVTTPADWRVVADHSACIGMDPPH